VKPRAPGVTGISEDVKDESNRQDASTRGHETVFIRFLSVSSQSYSQISQMNSESTLNVAVLLQTFYTSSGRSLKQHNPSFCLLRA
jgi:hypothetical protein